MKTLSLMIFIFINLIFTSVFAEVSNNSEPNELKTHLTQLAEKNNQDIRVPIKNIEILTKSKNTDNLSTCMSALCMSDSDCGAAGICGEFNICLCH